jgi:hypothetical protein
MFARTDGRIVEGGLLMDSNRFDHLTRSLGTSRRAMLGGVLAYAVTGLALPGLTAGKTNKPKSKPKPKPNQYGCLDVGDLCGRSSQCCSGTCDGKKGKKTCRAHDTGTCNQQKPGFCLAPNSVHNLCNNTIGCLCYRTTAGSKVCADTVGLKCADCRKDRDCETLGFGDGSVCIPTAVGACTGGCASGTACAAPCVTTSPQPSV